MTRTRQPVTAAVTKLLDGLTLDESGNALAAIALSLAATLDSVSGTTTGAAAQSAAGTARELRSTLEAILAPANATDADQFLRQILSTEATA